MAKPFILDLAAAPRQRFLFGLAHVAALFPIAISGIPWTIKIALGLVVALYGLWSDRIYRSGNFYPLRLVYDRPDFFTPRRKSHWRMRLPGNRWLDLRLHSHFNFLDVYLVLVFKKHDHLPPRSAAGSLRLRLLDLIKSRRQIIYLPCLLGDLSTDQLRQLRVLARMGD